MTCLRALASLIAGLALAFTSSAHELSVGHVDVQVPAAGGEMRVELDLAIRDLALTIPLDANGDESVTWGELLAARQELEALVSGGLRLSDAAGPCQLLATSMGTRRYDDGAYATLVMSARCNSGAALRIDYQLLFATDPQHRALVTVRRSEGVFTAIARQGATTIAVPASTGSPFASFVREGIGHILSGYDHLAFLLCLLLPAPLLWTRSGWRPATGWRPVTAQIARLVTAFTLAHSITLSLSVLGWVRPASLWIEAGIAASVFLAALNNLKPVVVRRLWLVTFAFGLLHGFGFAGALLEVGLPEQSRLGALLGFNIGVELGQLAVVALLLPALFVLGRKPWYPRLVMGLLSVLIAVLAAYWLFVRLRG